MTKSYIKSENDWQVDPDRLLLETPVLNVKAGPVLCKRSGRKKEFYLLDFPEWVNIVAVTAENEIVLIRQFRYGTNKMEIEIPGGMIEQGEDPVVAGCRELLEETGYAGDNARVIGKVCPNPALQRNTCYTVLVENARMVAPPDFDDMEDIECFLNSESEVQRKVETGAIDHGLVLNALMFYQISRQTR